MKQNFWNCLLGILVFSLFIVSCDKDSNDSNVTNNSVYLVSYEKVSTISATEIQNTVKEIYPNSDFTTAIRDVDYYKITYRADYLGKSVLLSGLVLFPAGLDGVLNQYHYSHGTLIPVDNDSHDGESITDAPSLLNHKSNPIVGDDFYEVRGFGLNMAARGVMVSMPDYSGYGISCGSLDHLYCCSPNLAQESYNMVMAARELAGQLNIKLTNNIALSGWSEGAAVSMYLQKLIEKKGSLSVSFNSCLAGPYCPEQLVAIEKTDDAYVNFVVGWWALSILQQADVDPSVFFKSTVVDLQSLISVCMQDNTTTDSIFKQTAFDNMDSLNLYASNNNAAKGWIPQGTLHLFHGVKDDVVPYEQTVSAINVFNLSGAPNDKVVLHSYPDGDHENFSDDFIDKTLQYLGIFVAN